MPVEALYSIEGSSIKDVLDILYEENFPPKYQALLDKQTKKLYKLDKQYYMTKGLEKEMPKLVVEKGICNLKQLMSVYIVGIVLYILCISLTKNGKELLLDAFKQKQ